MAVYGYDDLSVIFDNSAGTTVNISQSCLSVSGVDIEAILEETHAAGDSWVEQTAVGLNRIGDITLQTLYDDDADTGSNFMFKNIGETRTLQIGWGAAKTVTFETVIKNYRRMPSRGALTKAEVVLTPTGAAVEA